MFVINQKITLVCDVCGFEEIQFDGFIDPGGEYLLPELLAGWKKSNHLTFCPKHSVSLIIDGKDQKEIKL